MRGGEDVCTCLCLRQVCGAIISALVPISLCSAEPEVDKLDRMLSLLREEEELSGML